MQSKSPPVITATSQVSRFHIDTITTLSTEIDLKQVNVSVIDNDLVVDSHLKLKAGVHYSLVARNGEGKSTLLRAIADRIIPGISENMRILLVDQIEDNQIADQALVQSANNDSAISDPHITVTQKVVKSDRRRETAITEHSTLMKAFNSSSIDSLACAVASIRLARSEFDLSEAKKIALRRSGTRGAEARKELLRAERRVTEREAELKRAESGQHSENITQKASAFLLDIQSTLDSLDASATEARARSILRGLGFSQEQLDAKFATLSGGWRSRCSLASALLQGPDLLLLDEPTNFLDLQSIIWLQTYASALSSTVLAVSHDREFVDAISDEIIILRKRTLSYFPGNLSAYESNAMKTRKNLIKMQDAMDKKKAGIEKSIQEGRRTAKKTGDENRARMAKSRQKKLDERWGLEKSDKGTRFKLNRDFGVYALTRRGAIEIEEFDRPIHFLFPDPEPLRFPGSLISASEVTFKYPGATGNVVEQLNITIHPGSRTGLLGLNGRGKSTVVKLLAGRLEPTKGTIERHARLRLGYYAQHSVEELSSPDVAALTVLNYFSVELKRSSDIDIDEATARSFLGSLGLRGKKVLNPIGTLSGGQKVRLALALIVYPAPDLLILDEISTHLDTDTITALIHALRRFSGAVLLVSHDRHLMKCVVEGARVQALSMTEEDNDDGEEEYEEGEEGDGAEERARWTVYVVGMKSAVVRSLPGGTDEYVEMVERRMRKEGLL